jgi:hypothetical protein
METSPHHPWYGRSYSPTNLQKGSTFFMFKIHTFYRLSTLQETDRAGSREFANTKNSRMPGESAWHSSRLGHETGGTLSPAGQSTFSLTTGIGLPPVSNTINTRDFPLFPYARQGSMQFGPMHQGIHFSPLLPPPCMQFCGSN